MTIGTSDGQSYEDSLDHILDRPIQSTMATGATEKPVQQFNSEIGTQTPTSEIQPSMPSDRSQNVSTIASTSYTQGDTFAEHPVDPKVAQVLGLQPQSLSDEEWAKWNKDLRNKKPGEGPYAAPTPEPGHPDLKYFIDRGPDGFIVKKDHPQLNDYDLDLFNIPEKGMEDWYFAKPRSPPLTS